MIGKTYLLKENLWEVLVMQQGATPKKAEAWEGFWGTWGGGLVWTLHRLKWIHVYLHRQWSTHCPSKKIMDDIVAKRTNVDYAHDKQGWSNMDYMSEEKLQCSLVCFCKVEHKGPTSKVVIVRGCSWVQQTKFRVGSKCNIEFGCRRRFKRGAIRWKRFWKWHDHVESWQPETLKSSSC